MSVPSGAAHLGRPRGAGKGPPSAADRIDVATRALVARIDQARFAAFAERARLTCVVSLALAAAPGIVLTATRAVVAPVSVRSVPGPLP